MGDLGDFHTLLALPPLVPTLSKVRMRPIAEIADKQARPLNIEVGYMGNAHGHFQ